MNPSVRQPREGNARGSPRITLQPPYEQQPPVAILAGTGWMKLNRKISGSQFEPVVRVAKCMGAELVVVRIALQAKLALR
jgi:hypothetical protein